MVGKRPASGKMIGSHGSICTAGCATKKIRHLVIFDAKGIDHGDFSWCTICMEGCEGPGLPVTNVFFDKKQAGNFED